MPAQPSRSSFVVRGGLFADPADVLVSVEDSVEDGDGPVASVHVGQRRRGETLEAAIKRICLLGKLRNGKVRVTTVGKLIDAGFEVVLDTTDGQPACHHNVVFETPPDLEQAKAFVECFDSPIPNPAKE